MIVSVVSTKRLPVALCVPNENSRQVTVPNGRITWFVLFMLWVSQKGTL
jgi:hypothetical protein